MMPVAWVTKLPKGLREQPGWVFIGVLVALTGVSFLTGLSTSVVTQAIGHTGLRLWGSFLALSGLLTAIASWRGKPSLEKMALRWLAFSVLAYVLWLVTVVPIERSLMSFMLGIILAVMAEIRVAFIKLMFTVAIRIEQQEQQNDG